jgi:hypothetical protein
MHGELRNAYKILVFIYEGNNPLGEPDVFGTVILEWIVKE